MCDKNVSFDVREAINKLNELEKLALTPNEKGDVNLALAVKIEELKAKFAQINIETEKHSYVLNVCVQNKHLKEMIDKI